MFARKLQPLGLSDDFDDISVKCRSIHLLGPSPTMQHRSLCSLLGGVPDCLVGIRTKFSMGI